MVDSIEISPADPAWVEAFCRAARWLGELAGPEAHIEHIGSTAVPGLSAKPIIDVLIGMNDSGDLLGLAPTLEAHGFERGGLAGSPEASLFLSRDAVVDGPAINLHLTLLGGRQWRDLIRFRDALRSDPELARSYERLKRQLAQASSDLDAYTAGKSEFVARALGAHT